MLENHWSYVIEEWLVNASGLERPHAKPAASSAMGRVYWKESKASKI